MKRFILPGLLTLSSVFAQAPKGPFDPAPSLPVTGTLNINYRTRTADGRGKENVSDAYALDLNVANSAIFRGTIEQLPFIKNALSANQLGKLSFDLELSVVNPANPKQSRNVGKLFGAVPIDENNVYRYSDGAGVKVAVFPIGAAKGFESRFNGLAYGKPPAASGLAKMKQEAVRLVSGKGGAIVLTKYDKMSFENLLLPAGPVQLYPETTVSGTLFYDYGRSAWHFNNVTFIYNADGKRNVDTITGSIRWIEPKNRRATGEGHYEFDIRVNEPPPSESAVFAATADESAFFASDANVPALTGAMKYKDAFSGDTVVSSAVQVDLTASKLSKQQTMMLTKLILLAAIVPLNAE